MSLVKVWTELNDGKFRSLPAKIIDTKGSSLTIKYLSPTEHRCSKNRRIYKYEDDTYSITDESITEYLNSDSELDLGFQQIAENEYIKYDIDEYSEDEDDDYVPSSEDDDDEDSEDSEDSEEDGSEEYSEGVYSDDGGEEFS
jgi:hypothetical protein